MLAASNIVRGLRALEQTNCSIDERVGRGDESVKGLEAPALDNVICLEAYEQMTAGRSERSSQSIAAVTTKGPRQLVFSIKDLEVDGKVTGS